MFGERMAATFVITVFTVANYVISEVTFIRARWDYEEDYVITVNYVISDYVNSVVKVKGKGKGILFKVGDQTDKDCLLTWADGVKVADRRDRTRNLQTCK